MKKKKLTPAQIKVLDRFVHDRWKAFEVRANVADVLLRYGYIYEEVYRLPVGYWPVAVHVHLITDAGRAALAQENEP
jgi:hypothetical protein